MSRLLAIVLALIAASTAWSRSTAADAAPDDSPRPRPGERGMLLTSTGPSGIEEIPLEFLGTYADYLGPGYDLFLVRLEGEFADRVGVASGMSGSPVYLDGQLVGALSHRVGVLPREAIGLVTPAWQMREAARRADPGSPDPRASRIATPLLVRGLGGEARRWLATEAEELGFVVASSGGGGATELPPLAPGSHVGIELVRGDTTIAATGTVTWIEEGQVFAFGHSFIGTGGVEMPMVRAEVIHPIADLAGSMMSARTGDEIGAFVEDRITAIVGRTERRAAMVPIDLRVRGGAYGERRFGYEVVANPLLMPLLSGVVVSDSLFRNASYERKTTMLASGRIRLDGHADLPLEMAFAGEIGADPAVAIARRVQQTLNTLARNPFSPVVVAGIDLDVEVRPEILHYRVEDLSYDRGPLHPGRTLEVDCVLVPYRGARVTRRISISIPEVLPRTNTLSLVVGAPGYVERALGSPSIRRLRSVDDLDAMIELLSERRSEHRLTAAVYRSGEGIVAGGTAYEDLPPTARRLLDAAGGGGAESRLRVTRLANASIDLDGPVEGGVVVRLNVSPGLAHEGNR